MIELTIESLIHPLRKGGHRGPGSIMIKGGASPAKLITPPKEAGCQAIGSIRM
jgi:hypothetical protein